MVKFSISKIIPNCIYDDAIWDYFIEGRLSDKSKISLFDPKCLSEYLTIGQLIEIDISSIFVSRIKVEETDFFQGFFQHFNDEKDIFIGEAIKIIVDKSELKSNKISYNENSIYYFGQIRLQSIK